MKFSDGFLKRAPVTSQNLTLLKLANAALKVLASFLLRIELVNLMLGIALALHAGGLSVARTYGKEKPRYDQATTVDVRLLSAGSNFGTIKITVDSGWPFILFYLGCFKCQIMDFGPQTHFVHQRYWFRPLPNLLFCLQLYMGLRRF